MVVRLSGLQARIVTAIGSIASMIAHGGSQAEASPFLIEPEPIDTFRSIRPYMQSFVQASNTRFIHGSNSLLVGWHGSNMVLVDRAPHERAPWE